MRSKKFFTYPPCPKNTPVDSFVVLTQKSFLSGEFQEAGEAIAVIGAGLQHFGKVRQGIQGPAV
jgi:hypothetical protein